MISRTELNERVREWGLREDIVEKDYVLGWLLWGIGSNAGLSASWAFKGGTCLKKCYLETYRFSEDLDFTVLPGGPIKPDDITPLLQEIFGRVYEQAGIDFRVRPAVLQTRPDGKSVEGRAYYRGPRNAPSVASIKLDLTEAEQVIQPTVLRQVSHPYPDQLPEPATIRCYGFEELFAEKLRAMGERSRPRDLYDIVNLFRRQEFRPYGELVRSVYVEKCKSKGVEVFTFDSLENSPYRMELETEWANMLGHQLPVLPPFEDFWQELPRLFAWLDGKLAPEELPSISIAEGEEPEWTPPPTVWVWGQRVPFEPVRFAAANLGQAQRRHLIAHALAHHLLHCGNQLSFHQQWQAITAKQEHEAEECAAHILMPEEELKKVSDMSPWELAEYFDVPEELVRRRLTEFATDNELARWESARQEHFPD